MPNDQMGTAQDEDMFSDAEATPPAGGADRESQTEDRQERGEGSEDDGHGPVGELPKAVLGGKDFEPGDEVVLRVVSVGEDSVVVEYAPPEGEGDQGERGGYGGPPEGAGPQEGMGSMME